ncbi:hypothetical protein HNR30_003158 [Nonomuraea soli]|uniref:Uncharacterized protein n=1 Tax=Nonomuraea soli TaxID=1032476 RepID=A0A7W0HQH6_9ACTN|nr:hypothetical protein [Nonomuraea soli]
MRPRQVQGRLTLMVGRPKSRGHDEEPSRASRPSYVTGRSRPRSNRDRLSTNPQATFPPAQLGQEYVHPATTTLWTTS